MADEAAVTIYALCDEAGVIRYIGQTRRLEQRRREHRKALPGLTLIIVTMTDEAHADEVEQSWIERYRTQGVELLNGANYIPRGRRRPRKAQESWIAVRIPNDTKEWLEQWAERKDTSMSWIVRRLLVEAQQGRRDQKNGL